MKKILISLFSIIIMISMITSVQAATTGQITLTPSANTIKAGNEFSITIKASDRNNLNTIEYSGITITDANGNVINKITVKSIDAIGDWSKMNNEGNTAFVYGGAAVQSQDVCKITFTTDSDISEGTYNININGLVVYSTNLEDDTTTIGKRTVSVNIKESTTGGNTSGGNTTSGNTTGENKPTVNNSTNNQATKLPQTGLTNITVIGVVVLTIMIIVSYVSYIRIKEI